MAKLIGYRAVMSKIEEYHRARQICREKAAKAALREIRDVWQTIESSYALLIDLELRPRPALPGNVASGAHAAHPEAPVGEPGKIS